MRLEVTHQQPTSESEALITRVTHNSFENTLYHDDEHQPIEWWPTITSLSWKLLSGSHCNIEVINSRESQRFGSILIRGARPHSSQTDRKKSVDPNNLYIKSHDLVTRELVIIIIIIIHKIVTCQKGASRQEANGIRSARVSSFGRPFESIIIATRADARFWLARLLALVCAFFGQTRVWMYVCM